jgi:hypothetical protein
MDRKQRYRSASNPWVISAHTLDHNSLTGEPSLPAGAGGGLAASIATCPLDVVKTKLQAQRATIGQADYLGITGL